MTSRLNTQISGQFFLEIVLILGIVVITGCVNLKPKTDPTRYFVLGPTPSPSGSNQVGGAKIALGPIALPPYLQSQKIVTRRGEHEISYAEYFRWASQRYSRAAN